MSVDTDLITRVAEQLDTRLHHTVPCDGTLHQIGALGHNPEDNAAYTVTSPCCRRQFHMCDGRALYAWSTGLLGCVRCGVEHLVEHYTFTPLGSTQ